MNNYLDDYYYQQQKADLEQIAHFFDEDIKNNSDSTYDVRRVGAAPRSTPARCPPPETPCDDMEVHVATVDETPKVVQTTTVPPMSSEAYKPSKLALVRSRSTSQDTVSTVMADYFNDRTSATGQRERTLAPDEQREGSDPLKNKNSHTYNPQNSRRIVSATTSPYTLMPRKKHAVAEPTVLSPPSPQPPAAASPAEGLPSSLPPSSSVASPTGTDTISARSEARAKWEAERNNYDSTIASLAQSVQLEKQQRASLMVELDTIRKENQALREMMEKILRLQERGQPDATGSSALSVFPQQVSASAPRSPSPRSASHYRQQLLLSPPYTTDNDALHGASNEEAVRTTRHENVVTGVPAKTDDVENGSSASRVPPKQEENDTARPQSDHEVRDAPLAATSEPTTWCGPMHQFKPAAEEASNEAVSSSLVATYTAGGPVDEDSLYYRIGHITPLRLTQATFREKEQTIRETDGLFKAFAAELDKLALATGITTVSALAPSAASSGAPAPPSEVERMLAAFCYGKQIDYVDRAYPPITESLGGSGAKPAQCRRYVARGALSGTSVPTQCLIQWLPRALYTPPDRNADLLSSAGIDPQGLRVGPLGDMPVAAALAALAEATGAVTSLLASTTAAEEAQGWYTVWLCPQGAWQRVSVDGYLPCVVFPPPPAASVYATAGAEDGPAPSEAKVVLYGCSNRFTCDLWAPLCEKALAKLYGGYDVLPCLRAGRVLSCLTGGPLERWTWWRDRPMVAWQEMEAAMNTSSRGSGIVLLTTRSSVSIHYESVQQQQREIQKLKEKARRDAQDKGSLSDADYFDDDGPPTAPPPAAVSAAATTTTTTTTTTDPLPPAVALSQLAALELRPSTSYRVLAAAENEKGEPMLLVRNWLKGTLEDDAADEAAQQRCVAATTSSSTVVATSPQRCSPSRGDGSPVNGSDALNAHADHLKNGESCRWLNYHKEVVPLFDTLEVCFDCRRFHDVRIPVRFDGMEPSVPQHFFKVTVRPPPAVEPTCAYAKHAAPPARLWIGLHQPLGAVSVSGGELPAGAAHAAEPLDPECFWGLRLFLIGLNKRRSISSVAVTYHPAEYYMLSASYEGEYQHQPAIWMYVELDTEDLQRQLEEGKEEQAHGEENSFFIIPQIEGDVLLLQQRATQRAATGASRPPHARRRHNEMSCNYNHHSAVVSLLAEDPTLFSVEALRSPVEMTAAFCHEQVVCVDLDACERECSTSLQGKNEPTAPEHAARRSNRQQRSWSHASLGAPPSASLQTQVNGKWVDGFCWL